MDYSIACRISSFAAHAIPLSAGIVVGLTVNPGNGLRPKAAAVSAELVFSSNQLQADRTIPVCRQANPENATQKPQPANALTMLL